MAHVDLHIHTNHSDGTFSPEQIVFMAYHLNLSTIAITDHDKLGGIQEAIKAVSKHNLKDRLKVIPGVEVSIDYPHGNMHILGYYIDQNNDSLLKLLERGLSSRKNREPKVIEKLNSLGVQVTLEEAREICKKENLSRPEFADVLVHKNIVKDRDEAFSMYLEKGKLAYVKRDKIKPKEAIEAILTAGGIPVLAHPSQLEINPKELTSLIKELVSYGLKGLEIYHADHDEEGIILYKKLAQKFDLLKTGGSDFHGIRKFNVWLGQEKIEKEDIDIA